MKGRKKRLRRIASIEVHTNDADTNFAKQSWWLTASIMKENQSKYVKAPFIYSGLTCKAGDIAFSGLCTVVNCKSSCGE